MSPAPRQRRERHPLSRLRLLRCTLGTNSGVKPHLSTYYLRYYWWEIIAYNIDITGSANFGRNMRYYWMGRSYIKYMILLGWPSIYNIRYLGVSPASAHIIYAILLGWPTIYNVGYYWVSPPPQHIKYAILLGGPTTYNMRYYWVSPPPPHIKCAILLAAPTKLNI